MLAIFLIATGGIALGFIYGNEMGFSRGYNLAEVEYKKKWKEWKKQT